MSISLTASLGPIPKRSEDLMQAIGHVQAAAESQVIWGPDDPLPTRPMRGWHASHRHPLGLHRHDVPELCVAIRGESVLEYQASRFLLGSPMLAVIRAGTAHCESFHDAARGYELLYLLCKPRGVWSSVLTYRPSRRPIRARWSIPRRYWLSTDAAGRLHRLLIDPGLPGRTDRDRRLRAHLLLVLSELFCDHVNATTPDEASTPGRTSGEHLAIRVRNMIERDPGGAPPADTMARQMRVSPTYLHRAFLRTFGENIAFYTRRARMETALSLLHDTDLLIKEVAARVGFNDPLHFSRCFRSFHRISPAQARRYDRP